MRGEHALLISESNQKAIRERFAGLVNPVVVQYFESSLNCPMCSEVKMLLQELTNLSDLLSLEVCNIYADEARAKAAQVDKTPTIILTDDTRKDYGVRYHGAPSGYEFAALLEDILMVSKGDSGLQQVTRDKLASLANPVHLEVFVTPT